MASNRRRPAGIPPTASVTTNATVTVGAPGGMLTPFQRERQDSCVSNTTVTVGGMLMPFQRERQDSCVSANSLMPSHRNSCASNYSRRLSMMGVSRSTMSRLHGTFMSELDVMTRQRYMRPSMVPSIASLGTAVLSNPVYNAEHSSSFELRDFIIEQRKIVASFRSQPWPMQLKLEAVKGYKENISKYVPQLNTIDSFRDRARKIYVKTKLRLKNIGLRFSIWRNIIKKIEGNYGTSVGSYFRLVRWVCLLNFLLFVITYGFLLIPQLASGHGLDVPTSIRSNRSGLSYIIDGRGYALEYSVLFYGFYDSGQNEPYFPPPPNPIPSIGFHYKLPLAYLLTVSSLFIISRLIILFSMAKQYKLVQRSNIGGQYTFSWKVFASWDYAVTDPVTAKLKLKQHGVILKECLYEARKAEETVSLKMKVKIWAIRITTNIVIFIVLCITGYAIFLSAENASKSGILVNQQFELQGTLASVISNFFLSFQLQIVIILRNFLTPFVFQLFSKLEKFHPRTALKIHLLRMFVLYFSSLYVVMISLFVVSESCEGDPSAINCRCWETRLGQEMFKLMFTQAAAELTSILGLEGMRWATTRTLLQVHYRYGKMFNDFIGPAEFDISVSVLKLVYGQGLILFGVFFCPILPGIGFAKNVVIFYFRTLAVLVFNKPPRAYFQVASTHNFYMAVLLVTVFICALPLGYAVVEIRPSTACGPFRGLESIFQILPNEVDTWPQFLQTVLNYSQTATVVVPVISILLIVIYYYTALTASLKEFNKDLLLQLRVEQSETRRRIAQCLKRDDSDTHSGDTVKLGDRTVAGLAKLSSPKQSAPPVSWASDSASTITPQQPAGKSPADLLLLTKHNIESITQK